MFMNANSWYRFNLGLFHDNCLSEEISLYLQSRCFLLKTTLKKGPSDKNIKDEDYTGLSNMFELTEEPSVGQNKVQSCGVPELQCEVCKPCPPVFECPSTLEPETFKALQKDLGPFIQQRLIELLEKTRFVDSAFEVVRTIDMLKLLNASDSEFNDVREHMHNGAKRLSDASRKILEKKTAKQSGCLIC
ncbi:hypothetical protein Vadar_007349 [Vaccinium darrowii]|uniref:Uncharacterized protein n=1 Tax=Vaccinium darrowii TaxID=229202 RepID=A0ACB7ZIH2_9ERIC|nr:hypothetical protein Vadar_007349 [Vaccinium darrowii]